MNCPDPIEDLYNMYSGKEEETSRIVEVTNEDLDLESELREGLVNPYLEL